MAGKPTAIIFDPAGALGKAAELHVPESQQHATDPRGMSADLEDDPTAGERGAVTLERGGRGANRSVARICPRASRAQSWVKRSPRSRPIVSLRRAIRGVVMRANLWAVGSMPVHWFGDH